MTIQYVYYYGYDYYAAYYYDYDYYASTDPVFLSLIIERSSNEFNSICRFSLSVDLGAFMKK